MELSLSKPFLDQMQEILGSESLPDFLNELKQPPPVSIRYNPFKNFATDIFNEKVAWATDAYYLNERKSFTADPLFHAGVYYVQEASSMLIEQAFKSAFPDSTPAITLDLCAAPGGKSTHLLSLIKNKGILISNEIHPQRNAVLRQNISRWGCANVIVTRMGAEDFQNLHSRIDLLVCDAPCSGEGMFRKDPDAINEWSPAAVENCAVRQTQILSDINAVVKKGGYLIYSTCTYNLQENDEQVKALIDSGDWLLKDFDLSFTGAVKTKYGWQCFPHKVKGEGFYISLLQKTNGGINSTEYKKNKATKKNQFNKIVPQGYSVSEYKNYLNLFPEDFTDEMNYLIQNTRVTQAGVPFGEFKGRDFIPSAEFALSLAEKSGFTSAETDYNNAIRFLRCENNLEGNFERGWNLVNFQNHPLGWIKAIQGRINNYYPRNWRILKDADKLK